MEKFAVIVAGGSGTRMKNAVPKQFLPLKGLPVLLHTLQAFEKADPEITLIVVLPADHIKTWEEICGKYAGMPKHHVAGGGETRFHSVKNGLASITGDGLVGVHDGVRPLITPGFINSLYAIAAKTGHAIPVIPVKESLRAIEKNNSTSVDRNKFFMVQTPQVFRVNELKGAFRQPYSEAFTDEATVMELAGHRIITCEGEENNIKLTTPRDFLFAKAVLDS